MGSPRQAPGAVAEFRVLPAENCFAIPETVSIDEAALVEPLTIGLHAVRLGQVAPRSRIALFGAGPIGLSVLLCAKAVAPGTVYATDLLDDRLEVARQCGADWAGSPRRDDVVAAIAAQEPEGVDLAFECSGDPACIDQALGLLTPGGTLVLVGIPAEPRIRVDVHTMRTSELTVRNVRRQNGCLPAVIRMLAEGRIHAGPLLTHHYPLARIRDAFELVADYRDGVIKAMLDVSS